MKNKAFTLIELLVVILIIGILAAIAYPKYQYIILKTRYTEIKFYGDTLYKAIQNYHFANNSWPHKFTDLDLQLPGQIVWRDQYLFMPTFAKHTRVCYIWEDANGWHGYLRCGDSTGRSPDYWRNFYDNSDRYCIPGDNDLKKKFCKEETGSLTPVMVKNEEGYKYQE